MRRLLGAAVSALILLSGCGADSPDEAAPTPSTGPSSTAAPSTAAKRAANTCPRTGPQEPPPGDAGNQPGGDFDGDSQPDRVWPFTANDRPAVRILTASGAGSDVVVPGPGPRILGSADVDSDGRDELFMVEGGNFKEQSFVKVVLVQLVGCKAAVVENAQGRPYEFDVGREGMAGSSSVAGVGCAEIGGRRRLVGLSGVVSGTTADWKRTVVRLEDGRAVNGDVDQGQFREPDQHHQIELLSTVSCGDRVMDPG